MRRKCYNACSVLCPHFLCTMQANYSNMLVFSCFMSQNDKLGHPLFFLGEAFDGNKHEEEQMTTRDFKSQVQSWQKKKERQTRQEAIQHYKDP